ncbi:hypothetical protein L5515_019686 [Caenorhabditis briggsae]|uniref:Uncharacterized protein n=1 Tax=Caenorhabditis briggsae TaxID=6238 RepID=A0AAE9FEP4_CAEBR|nr:hypothetical protein L5515_019686 [Caenorhabditis briggsae]
MGYESVGNNRNGRGNWVANLPGNQNLQTVKLELLFVKNETELQQKFQEWNILAQRHKIKLISNRRITPRSPTKQQLMKLRKRFSSGFKNTTDFLWIINKNLPPKFEHEYEAEEYGKTELMECQTDQVRIIRWSTLSVV